MGSDHRWPTAASPRRNAFVSRFHPGRRQSGSCSRSSGSCRRHPPCHLGRPCLISPVGTAVQIRILLIRGFGRAGHYRRHREGHRHPCLGLSGFESRYTGHRHRQDHRNPRLVERRLLRWGSYRSHQECHPHRYPSDWYSACRCSCQASPTRSRSLSFDPDWVQADNCFQASPMSSLSESL